MDILALKLYHDAGTRSARVRWTLLEIRPHARFELKRVSLRDGEHRTAAFEAISPNRAVPVLEITWQEKRRTHMMESAAILTFLADAHPRAALAPPPGASPERGDYLQMVHFGSTTMDMLLWELRLHERLLPESDRDHRALVRNREAFVTKVEPYLEERLARSTYICGAKFSAADCVVGHNVLWARRHGLCESRTFARYVSTLSSRPACVEAFDDNQNIRADLLDSREGDV